MQQLTLFNCDAKTLEKTAQALVSVERLVLDLENEIKEVAQALRDSDLTAELKRLREELKSAKLKRSSAAADLAHLERKDIL